MSGPNNVHRLYRDGITHGPGHNEPTFQDDIDAILRTGTLRICLQQVCLAIRDDRLERGHLKILECLIHHLSSELGTAFASRQAIADRTGFTPKTVGNLLYELRTLGYVDWETRPTPSYNGRVLMHYVLPIARHEPAQIERAITLATQAIREKIGRESVAPAGMPVLAGSRSVPPSGQSKYPARGACPARRIERLPSRLQLIISLLLLLKAQLHQEIAAADELALLTAMPFRVVVGHTRWNLSECCC